MTPASRDRATRRRRQLQDRYGAGPLELLTDIYRDRDWAVLDDPDGRPFRAFTAFVAHDLGVSDAYARRYQQTIRALVLPITKIAGPRAATAITLSDMEHLGTDGAKLLLDRVAADPPDPTADPHTALRAHIAAAITDRHTLPNTPELKTQAAQHIASAVPDRRPESATNNDAPPWDTSDGAATTTTPTIHTPPWAPATPERSTTSPAAGTPTPHLTAALQTIIDSDPATAAEELADRIPDLVRAAVHLTNIRAHALTLTTGS